MTVRFYSIIILLFLCSYSFAIFAESKEVPKSDDEVAKKDEFALCRPFSEIAPPRPNLPPLENESIRLFSDSAIVQEKLGTSTFSGRVLVQKEDMILSSPHVFYDRNKEILDADKEFLFWDNDYVIQGSQIQLRKDEQGEMTNAEYWLLSRRARGHAKQLLKESKDIVQLEQSSYTTCDPDSEVWRLDTSHLTLDNANSVGVAHHVIVRLLNMPVFYVPYLSFPIGDQRKSGFLVPSGGSSDETGTEFSIPYYLNLAPNYDATLTPRIMSRRGVMLRSELRYLTQLTDGNLKVEYMPHDQAFKDERASLVYKHRGWITPSKNWMADIDINYASDRRYFEELGNDISVASITHLERRGDLIYYGNGWYTLGRVQTFQTLDQNPFARPYQRLPQLLFETFIPERNRRLHLDLEAEWVRFNRDIEVVDAPIGNRFDIYPIVSFPMRTPGTFVVPSVSLQYTRYDLDNVEPGEDTSHNRFLWTVAMDSGLFLERDISLFDNHLLQTLEPRLYYRYRPYEDQSDIPIFDTAEYDLSFLQFFRDNRFSGPDRVDDGHQTTLGITSRFLGATTGIEHFRASLGQVFYFRDRRVTMPFDPVDVESDASSSIIMELAAQFAKRWRGSSVFRWNPHDNNTEQTVLRVRYYPALDRIFNISYRMRDREYQELLEQTDMSLYWALSPRWTVLGRWNYSLPEGKTLETFTGIEYSSCCWAIRGITRRYLNSVDGSSYLNGFFLQFQMTGLGTVGQKADSFLEQRIPGYEDEF
jgi:LPS-assembly protein